MPGDSRIRWYVCYERKRKTFSNKQRMTNIEWKKISTNFRTDIHDNNMKKPRLIRSYLKAHFMRAPAIFVDIFLFLVLFDDEKDKIIQWFSKTWWFFFISSLFGFVYHRIIQILSKRSSMFECRWLKLNVTFLISIIDKVFPK